MGNKGVIRVMFDTNCLIMYCTIYVSLVDGESIKILSVGWVFYLVKEKFRLTYMILSIILITTRFKRKYSKNKYVTRKSFHMPSRTKVKGPLKCMDKPVMHVSFLYAA